MTSKPVEPLYSVIEFDHGSRDRYPWTRHATIAAGELWAPIAAAAERLEPDA